MSSTHRPQIHKILCCTYRSDPARLSNPLHVLTAPPLPMASLSTCLRRSAWAFRLSHSTTRPWPCEPCYLDRTYIGPVRNFKQQQLDSAQIRAFRITGAKLLVPTCRRDIVEKLGLFIADGELSCLLWESIAGGLQRWSVPPCLARVLRK